MIWLAVVVFMYERQAAFNQPYLLPDPPRTTNHQPPPPKTVAGHAQMVALLLENGARVTALSSPPTTATEGNGNGKAAGGATKGGNGKGGSSRAETALELVQRALKGEVVAGGEGAGKAPSKAQLKQGAFVCVYGCVSSVGLGTRGGGALRWGLQVT